MHQGATVRGINTAATVWCSAAVGVLAGMGLTLWAGAVTVLVLLTNVVLHYAGNRISGSDPGA
jgi:putative Mg2+ transporter-C (MgtC) family protein